MSSAIVNNIAALSPEPFGWLSPRISFSRDFPLDVPAMSSLAAWDRSDADASGLDFVDFEFRLHDPVAMLPADELFSDGKLVPLQLSTTARLAEDDTVEESPPATEIRSPESPKTCRASEVLSSDAYVFSPRAPRCASRWRELLGLRRIQNLKADAQKAAIVVAVGKNPNIRSLKKLLHRNHKATAVSDTLFNLPLLREADSESASINSSRTSLSSSSSSSSSSHSSSADLEDLPRFSLDSEKLNKNAASESRIPPPQLRLVRPIPTATTEGHQPAAARAGRSSARGAAEFAPPPPRGLSVDSPRMSSSGKIVYHGLERSSSSPGSFTGGPRPRPRRIERSYSANVRVAPVLNVSVRSLCGSGKPGSAGFVLGSLFSPQKKDKDRPAQTGSNSSARSGSSKPKIDRKIKPNIN